MLAAIDAALTRRKTVVLSLLVVLIAGFATYLSIPKEAEPDVEIPYIYVSLSHDGISPEDAERLLVRPVEQEVRNIEGIKEITSAGYEGGGNVSLEFYAGMDTGRALQDVREKVDLAKSKLPQDADDPIVQEVKFAKLDPMLILNIGGEVPERTLLAVARDLKQKIEGIPGVLEVDVTGDREELMEIIVDPLSMEGYGLDLGDIYNFVDRNNKLVAAGSLQTSNGRFPVKVPGVIETAEDLLTLPIKVDGDRVVHFSDIASVRRTFKDATSYARLNGQPSLALEVVQRTGANIIHTVSDVMEVVEVEQGFWPAGITVTASQDKSEDIREMLTDLQNNVLSAVLLVFIVIISILGIRNALLVGIAIPGSFLMGILALSVFGLTINIVVLFSLIMAVGMLVDGAIVVTELADRRMAEGLSKRQAYSAAARRMAWPIIASTATTLAAFAPLAFWPGIMGEFMKYLPLTLIATLSASLVMALLFVPTLGSLFGKPGTVNDRTRRALAAAEHGDLDSIGGFTGAYISFLKRAMKHPWLSVAGVTALLVGIFVTYVTAGHGVQFFPDVEPPFSVVEIRARGDLGTDEKDAIVRQVEERLLGIPEFESIYTASGDVGGRGGAEDQIGRIQLNFVDWDQRRPADEIIEDVRARTGDIAGIVIDVRKPQAGPPREPIKIELTSRYPAVLNEAAATVRRTLEEMDGVINVTDDRGLPGIEWKINVDRAQAARFGADVSLVGTVIQLVTNGIKVGEYRPDDADEEIDIRVRFPYDSRSLSQIDDLRLPSRDGNIPLSTFMSRDAQQKVTTINRTDLRRTVTINADVAPGVLESDKIAEFQAMVPELGLASPALQVQFKGGNEQQQESQAFLGRAFAIALAVMALILVTQFNSIFQAFLILTAVVFSTGGVFLGHIIMQQPFGIVMSGIGVVALAGIVVNNNIVLIDTYNILRREGIAAFEAVLRTCALRLRPVLLTTVTTILGLLPMVFGINIDLIDREIAVGAPSSQWWTQLSASVAGGLAFATVLTLLLTPSLLTIQANLSRRWRRSRARRAAVRAAASQEGTISEV